MTKKRFELTSEGIKRIKLMAGVVEGGFIKRNIHMKNGSHSSITLQTVLKDIPDDCRIPVGNFASLLSICGLFKNGIEIDYSDYDPESHLMVKVLEKGNEKSEFNFVVADDSYIESLDGELPEDVEFENDSPYNEFTLTPEQISFMFSAGSNINADCIEFKVDKNSLKVELYNTTINNNHRFTQIIEGADIAHDVDLKIDFAGAFKKLDPSIEYSVRVYSNEFMEFKNEVEHIKMVVSKLENF